MQNTSEMMDETLDGALDDDETEGETSNLVDQVRAWKRNGVEKKRKLQRQELSGALPKSILGTFWASRAQD